ncbi:unnamed protein product [Ixodes pacificus]
MGTSDVQLPSSKTSPWSSWTAKSTVHLGRDMSPPPFPPQSSYSAWSRASKVAALAVQWFLMAGLVTVTVLCVVRLHRLEDRVSVLEEKLRAMDDTAPAQQQVRSRLRCPRGGVVRCALGVSVIRG